MRITEAIDYVNQPLKPDAEYLYRYSHITITDELEKSRREMQRLRRAKEKQSDQ